MPPNQALYAEWRLNRRYDEMQAEFALVPLTISETSQEEEL